MIATLQPNRIELTPLESMDAEQMRNKINELQNWSVEYDDLTKDEIRYTLQLHRAFALAIGAGRAPKRSAAGKPTKKKVLDIDEL